MFSGKKTIFSSVSEKYIEKSCKLLYNCTVKNTF